MPAAPNAGPQETRLRVEALENKMDVIDQKLSATVRALASGMLWGALSDAIKTARSRP